MHPALALLVHAADPTPTDNAVVAGWGGFAVFMGLVLAVAVLGYCLIRSLKTARKNLYVEPEEAPEGHPTLSADAQRDARDSGEIRR